MNEHEWKPSIRSLSLLWDVKIPCPEVMILNWQGETWIKHENFPCQLMISVAKNDVAMDLRKSSSNHLSDSIHPNPFFLVVFTSFKNISLYHTLARVLTCFDRRLSQKLSQLTSNNLEPSWGICIRQSCLSSFSSCAGVQPLFQTEWWFGEFHVVQIIWNYHSQQAFDFRAFVDVVKVLFAQAEGSDVGSFA